MLCEKNLLSTPAPLRPLRVAAAEDVLPHKDYFFLAPYILLHNIRWPFVSETITYGGRLKDVQVLRKQTVIISAQLVEVQFIQILWSPIWN